VPDVSATNFAFLTGEWPAVFESAAKAEALAHPDARRLLLRPPCARDRLDLLAEMRKGEAGLDQRQVAKALVSWMGWKGVPCGLE
jgi:hypothetical protein